MAINTLNKTGFVVVATLLVYVGPNCRPCELFLFASDHHWCVRPLYCNQILTLIRSQLDLSNQSISRTLQQLPGCKGVALTPRRTMEHRNADSRGKASVMLLLDRGDHSRSPTADAVGHTMPSKDSAEMQSPHALTSPPSKNDDNSASVAPVALAAGSSL